MAFAWKAAGITYVRSHQAALEDPEDQGTNTCEHSYNRYLAVAARVVRRSLKDDKRLVAERRGEMDLKFAKWEGGKQGENKSLADANAASMAEHAGASQ
ncbi:hypothetical protein LTR27_007017 [Elasticomyces elasticus]|nr:hypothetical protein LTR27_007017 [Elasticomyces elasticus]